MVACSVETKAGHSAVWKAEKMAALKAERWVVQMVASLVVTKAVKRAVCWVDQTAAWTAAKMVGPKAACSVARSAAWLGRYSAAWTAA